MLDICNGLALAYKIFFFKKSTNVQIPMQVLVEELYAQTEAPWWKIEGCLESEVGKNDSQLVIFIKPETRDYGKVRLSAIMTAVLAERFAPGYKRYFLSMRSPIALHGFVAFDGEAIRDKRKNKASKWEEYSGIIDGDLIFWVPFIKLPKLINKINTYYLSLKLFLSTQRLLKIISSGVELHSRNAKIHRNGWRVILNADVVIESSDIVAASDVKNIGNKLIKIALKAARKQQPIYSFLRYLPLGYARVSLFSDDYRCSHLQGFGLRKELIGTVKLQKIMRIKSPDLLGSSIEHDGRLTYAWNRSWLEQ